MPKEPRYWWQAVDCTAQARPQLVAKSREFTACLRQRDPQNITMNCIPDTFIIAAKPDTDPLGEEAEKLQETSGSLLHPG